MATTANAPLHAEHVLPASIEPSGDLVEVRNPANIDEVVGTYIALTADHVDQAVDAANAAQPEWAAMSARERADRLMAAAADIAAIDGLDRLLTREQGKALWESSFEVGFYEMAASGVVDYVDRLEDGDLRIDDGMGRAFVHNEPYGVVGAITPWNYPLAISAIKVVPALMAGNAMVLALSPTVPLAALATYRAVAAHLPDGILTVMAADGPTVAQRIVEHPGVPKVAFTGSTRTGRLVGRLAAEQIKDVTLELGGNDAAIVLDDCEIDEMMLGDLIMGAFTTAGQICMGIKRIFVPHDRVEEVAAGMAELLDTYVVGPGIDEATTMGPLHNRAQRDKVVALLEDARAHGATIRECGTLNGDPEKGHFLLPSIVTGVGDDVRIVREEQFGPSVPILGYDSVSEAIARANQTEYGLCSSVWSSDEERALRLARQLQSGSTFINSHGLFSVDPRVPFGGFKQSGSGREMGYEGVLAFSQRHTVSTRHM